MLHPGLGTGPQGQVLGQLKQPVLTDAQRGAEALFTTKTISEIREVWGSAPVLLQQLLGAGLISSGHFIRAFILALALA